MPDDVGGCSPFLMFWLGPGIFSSKSGQPESDYWRLRVAAFGGGAACVCGRSLRLFACLVTNCCFFSIRIVSIFTDVLYLTLRK